MDAANYSESIKSKTLVHEYGHNLGLKDEYLAGYYPWNLLGEKDSFMRDSGKFDSRLYPRHFMAILRPSIRCGNPFTGTELSGGLAGSE